MGILGFFEPEERVGEAWHSLAARIGGESADNPAAVALADVQASLATLFRALGGAHDVELVEATSRRVEHKRRLRRRLAHGVEAAARPSFDGERLCLPPSISAFATARLNRLAYQWLVAAAATGFQSDAVLPAPDSDAGQLNEAYLRLNLAAARAVLATCPGLHDGYSDMLESMRVARAQSGRADSAIERCIRAALGGAHIDLSTLPVGSGPHRVAPVPFWLDFYRPPGAGSAAQDTSSETDSSAPSRAATAAAPKAGQRRELAETNRKDSFIVHRFETILSWVESMDINRTVENDDEENARKAADDQDSITLSRHDKKTASRLHLHLDLSPAEAEHERLAGKFTYPEWSHRKGRYLEDHCRVLEADAPIAEEAPVQAIRGDVERVRRQFETLRTRRVLQPRQTDGNEIDLDALIAARADLAATGRGSDRVYIASRKRERDLSVGLLLDTSRSTEADLGGTSVIDVSRHALTALAHGLDACGDRFGIWSFSSLRRNRVFLSCCKSFAAPMSALVDRRIAALRPGHYTRLGSAIRHTSMRLAKEHSAQKLLLVLTDGKPNDIDHYEGKHGVEDSRVAVREARRQGQVVHSVIIDADGQDWFARIFERSGFTLLPRPERLMSALPDIYRSLTKEF